MEPGSESTRNALPLPSSSASSAILHAPAEEEEEAALPHIQAGSFYEIDHSNLSPEAPEQLKWIRIVMASEKSKEIVSLRFPSVYSLRAHLRNGKKLLSIPALNEKYVMPSEQAGEVLYRRIPPEEIAERRNSWNFWAVPYEIDQGAPSSLPSPAVPHSGGGPDSKKGLCLSELKFAGLVQWGERRQVRYIGRHHDLQKLQEVKSSSIKEESDEQGDHPEGKEKDQGSTCEEEEEDGRKEEEEAERVDDQEEQEDQEEEGDREEEEAVSASMAKRKNLKRKRQNITTRRAQRLRKSKPEMKNQIQILTNTKKKELKRSIDRWSAERYKLAEQNMLKIMKAKGAVYGKPILRPELRAEARKLIGDTGLLDHLLKHMAGKVAPGGDDRFRRWHNADGAMEYWLESADLVNIRKNAGVQDPYWTPPIGWKPGDSPTQDPVCAGQIKELKEEIARLKQTVKKLESGKKENLDVVVGATDPDEGDGYFLPLKTIYEELLNRKAKIEEQMTQICQSLSGMEGLMKMAKARGFDEEQNLSVSEQAGLAVVVRKQNEEEVAEQEEEGEEEEEKGGGDKAGGRITREDKAAKIRRLRSGFRICRPHGTFLWPNNGITCNYSPDQFHRQGVMVVPTPPSASSTTHHHRHHLFPASPTTTPQLAPAGTDPTSPVKPLARRPGPRPGPGPVSSSTATTTTTFSAADLASCSTLLNLNEASTLHQPLHHMGDAAISGTHTYQRKHQNILSYSQNEVPRLVEANSDNERDEEERDKARKLSSVSSSASSSTPSLLSTKEGEGVMVGSG